MGLLFLSSFERVKGYSATVDVIENVPPDYQKLLQNLAPN
jgi:hypothetical protein